MWTTRCWLAWLLVLGIVAGCGKKKEDDEGGGDGVAAIKTHEDFFKEAIKLTNEYTDVLKQIKDASSAGSQKAKLESIKKRKEALMKKAKELGEPKPEEGTRIIQKYFGDMQKAEMSSNVEKNRVLKIPGLPEDIKKLIEELEKN
jgi:flagellar biosynthesis/type III secretory pathway chaperone